jgi:hypothetical protein
MSLEDAVMAWKWAALADYVCHRAGTEDDAEFGDQAITLTVLSP